MSRFKVFGNQNLNESIEFKTCRGDLSFYTAREIFDDDFQSAQDFESDEILSNLYKFDKSAKDPEDLKIIDVAMGFC